MTRKSTMVGDIFEIAIDGEYKKYFQFIGKDKSLLGSDVIRVFEPAFGIEESPDLSEVVKNEPINFMHVFLKVGLKLGVWKKVGNSSNIGDLDMYFRSTDDLILGKQVGAVSETWWVWRMNDEPFYVGKLTGKYRDSHPGLVLAPEGVIAVLKGQKYPANYPDIE